MNTVTEYTNGTAQEHTGEVQEEKAANDVTRETRLPVFTPAANIYENDKEVVFVIDMPGVDEKSVDISVENNLLVIEGKFTAAIPTSYDSIYHEFRYGNYKRKFELSKPVDIENARAEMKNGQLTLRIDLVKPEVKKIQVK